MLLRILGVFVLFAYVEPKIRPTCVTGYMTDVQNWVDEDGVLTTAIEPSDAIDLSVRINPVTALYQKMDTPRFGPNRRVRYFSMAKCRLSAVPPVFHIADPNGRLLSQTVEYMTFFGNIFADVDTPGENYYSTMNATDAQDLVIVAPYNSDLVSSVWSTGLQVTSFPKLKELDLRACFIKTLTRNMFRTMSSLEALYLGENMIHFIEADAFANLISLVHLDLSRNLAYDEGDNQKSLEIPKTIFENLYNLVSLDLSFTKLTQRNVGVLRGLGTNLKRLSLCDAGLTSLSSGVFSGTSLKVLDLSGNNGVLSDTGVFRGLDYSIQVIYARNVGLQSIDVFKGLRYLEVLQIAGNEVTLVPQKTARSWNSLQILDLTKNRLNSWFRETYSLMPNLRFLSLKDNTINFISEEMIRDMSLVNYLAMSGNFIVCNCYTRDFFELAAANERTYRNVSLSPNNSGPHPKYQYHKAFNEYNKIIARRKTLVSDCEDCAEELKIEGDFVLLDYTPSSYMCVSVATSQSVPINEVISCHNQRDLDYDDVMAKSENKLLALLVIPCVLLPMFVLFIFRRNLRYCVITMRNSAMLSLINKNEVVDDVAIFNYDVFVSYCNEDRGWVLDHLLPHLESDCSISACLHERDFQVGLSILENIVSCMDRSRSIMLIISQRFLLSQWCQFEMHLAQHRLLETRREDLTLVLLEEIPRRLRPTTLHYLMLTKTYIVWPQTDSERALFWKRLRKSLVTPKLKHPEGVSIA